MDQPVTTAALPLDVSGVNFAPGSGRLRAALSEASDLARVLSRFGVDHLQKVREGYAAARDLSLAELRSIWSPPADPMRLASDWAAYVTDAAQRGAIFLDIMREVGNTFNDQMAGTASMVLAYDHEMILDGRQFDRPVNYALIRIVPPGGMSVDPDERPFIIVDPRAGHGPGIGGFRSDSEVGVAMERRHPVYFVIFFHQPEPGQTLSDVTAAEGRFLREVAQRHPNAPKPVVIGNCQGGWATALVAASNPHVTGPVVLNGAPMSYWAGERGKNPMRYKGGLVGGAMPALLLSDLGNGKFDGANLVLNFETMNPGNTWWSKYYNVFRNADTEGPRFQGFEKWWSSFYFTNEEEIRWIVENLFVGNRLQRGAAILGGDTTIDLREIRSPIIVFASKGDDITPPPQALNWIPAVYGDEKEIRARGQRILYMVHDQIGHLGIFVSAQVARKEHDRIVTTLDAVEALAPGLYEMQITKVEKPEGGAYFTVAFEERTIADLRTLDDGEDDEEAFASVARLSGFLTDAYEIFARPTVRSMVTPVTAEAMVHLHPLRARRSLLSDRNPAMAMVKSLADGARAQRKPVASDNPLARSEAVLATMVGQVWDYWRDVNAIAQEFMFFSIYSNPFVTRLAEKRGREPNEGRDAVLHELPEVQSALRHLRDGGYPEAVIRMLILMARSRGAVRQSRLERSNAILHNAEPFNAMSSQRRVRIINEQTLAVDFDPEQSIATLPDLLPDAADRRRAIALIEEIAGDFAEMSEPTARMLANLRGVLGVTGSAAEPEAAARLAERRRAATNPIQAGQTARGGEVAE